MDPSKKTNSGWILCPSKSFPGKFYYFNVATGETAWCLDETERQLLKNSPLQRSDHSYPEPSSPPTEDPTNIGQQTIKYIPYNSQTFPNYPQDMYQNSSNNICSYIQPIDQMSNMRSYQMQIPMIWPMEGNMPQVVMIVMNQAMRQMAIGEPKDYRQPSQAKEPNRAWNEPNRSWHRVNQTLHRPNQAWLGPNQGWNPNQVLEPNQLWKEPNQAPKEPDREIFVRSGTVPLSERFVNYKKAVIDKKVVEPSIDTSNNQNNVSTNNSRIPAVCPNQPLDCLGPSNQNVEKEQKPLCSPIFNFGMESSKFCDTDLNIAKKNLEINKSDSDTKKASPHPFFGQKPFPSTSQNLPRTSVNNFNQEQTNQKIFGQTQTKDEPLRHGVASNKQPFNQGQEKQELFGRSTENENIFGQRQQKNNLCEKNLMERNNEIYEKNPIIQQPKMIHGKTLIKQPILWQTPINKELFGKSKKINTDHIEQSQTPDYGQKQINFGQNRMKQPIFGQSELKQPIFGQSQTKPTIVPSKACPKVFQVSNLESNPFQKLIAEKPITRYAEDLITRPGTNLEVPCFEDNDQSSNAKEKPTLKCGNKRKTSQDAPHLHLDKNDMRWFLLEKKRKYNAIHTPMVSGGKRIKTYIEETIQVPKKKVRFHLPTESLSDTDNEDNEDIDCIEKTKNVSWYMVTDANTLLEDFAVLDRFVQSDPSCHLIIPSQVMSDIVALSRGGCRERSSVTLARHLLRALATPSPSIIVQECEESIDIVTNDSILNCCLEVMDNSYVVLITGDEDLKTSAECLKINCLTVDHIKNGQAKSKIRFDGKEIKNSVEEHIDIDVPTKKLECLSFDNDWTNQKRSSTSPNKNIKTESGLDYKTNKEKAIPFEIQKNAGKFNINLKRLDPRSNISTSPFHTKEKERDTAKSNAVPIKKPIFYIDTGKSVSEKDSIFKIDEIEKLSENSPISNKRRSQNSNFKKYLPQHNMQVIYETEEFENKEEYPTSISEIEKYENKEPQSQPSIFEIEKYDKNKAEIQPSYDRYNKNSESQSKLLAIKHENTNKGSIFLPNKNQSIFETVNGNRSQLVTDNIMKNKFLDEFLMTFYEKNKVFEHLIEDRKEEIGCSLIQIMEDSLNQVLQNKSDFIFKKYQTLPLWTLAEMLEYIPVVYNTHTYIRDSVAMFTSVLNAQDVAAEDVIRTVGCGLALVKYMIFITEPTEALKDAESSLQAVLQNMTEDTEVEVKTPTFTAKDVYVEERKKHNFIKDTSDVVKYLKKHFPAWADYDETLDGNTPTPGLVWGKNFKEPVVLRTYGKNLSMLKLNTSKPMTMESDSPQNNQNNHNNMPTKYGHENTVQNDTIKNGKDKQKTELMDVENMDLDDTSKSYDRKLTRIVKNTALIDNLVKYDPNTKTIEKKDTEPKQTEQKVVRIFNEIDFSKNATEVQEKQNFDDFSSHGHSFGTEQNGPKILRNIQLIDEFEEKIKERTLFDLDDLNYSVVSKSDEVNKFSNETANNGWFSMGFENNDAYSKIHKYTDAKNDIYATNDKGTTNDKDATNDKDLKNDIQNMNSNNSSASNYETLSMSLDKCMKNDIYNDIDFDIPPTNDNFIDFCVPNDGQKVTNDNLYTIFGENDMRNDFVVKDDMTNDSGFVNCSEQAYQLMDSFLYELKVTFNTMHMFIEKCTRGLCSGLSVPTSRTVCDTTVTTRAHLTKIMEKLHSIIQRESFEGPTLKHLVGARSFSAMDPRIEQYREMVRKCHEHAQTVDKVLQVIISVADGRKW